MNILLIGSGGREHALAWKIAQSPKLKKLYIAPGNAGTAELGENISIPVNDFEELGAFSIKNNIDFIVVGPEDPLVNGITDYFLQHSEYATIPVIGPGKEGAKLEGSKEYAKEFMQRNHIPTAGYLSVNLESIEEGFRFLDAMKPPYVLKADGLAAGKGRPVWRWLGFFRSGPIRRIPSRRVFRQNFADPWTSSACRFWR